MKETLCKIDTSSVYISTNFLSIFPPGVLHCVYTSEDCLCSGGHFLYSRVMDRTIAVLKTLELKPDLTNDCIPVDIFKIILTFTERLLENKYDISSRQYIQYCSALDEYVGTSKESSMF